MRSDDKTKGSAVPASAALPFARHKNSAGYGKLTIHQRRRQVQHKLFPARPSLYLPGQNSIIRIASRGQSRCVWRSLLRREGAGCCSRPAPACTILCLSFYYSECSVKKQPGFFDRTEMNRNFLKKSGGFAFSAKNLRVPCQFGAPGDPE